MKTWFNSLPGPLKAAVWMTASALFYTVSVTIVRHLSQTLPSPKDRVFRNFLALLFMLPRLMGVGIGAPRTRQRGLHIVRGLFSAVSLWCTFSTVAVLQPIIGALIVIRPGVDALSMGVRLALCGTLAAAIVPLFVKVLAQTDRPDTIAVYLFVFHAVLAPVPAILVWRTLGSRRWVSSPC